MYDECSPAVGYVDEMHPIRPGQRNCAHWIKFAECKFGQRCVFNHPELPGSITKKLRAAEQAAISSGSSAANASRATQAALKKPTAAKAVPAAPASTSVTAYTAAGSSSATAHTATGIGTSTYTAARTGQIPLPPSSSRSSSSTVPAPAPAPAGPDTYSTDAAAAEAGSSSTVAVCPMFLMRGVCMLGSRCPYSHTTGGSRTATPEPSRSVTPVLAQQAAAATAAPIPAPPNRAESSAAAAAGPQYTSPAEQATSSAAAAAGSSSGAFQQRQQQQEPLTWQQQQYHQHQHQQQDDDDDYDTNYFTWQQQQQQQQQLTTKQQKAQQNKAHYKQQAQQQQQQQQLFPITGSTPEGLPYRPGAPNCPYYMHTGHCKFGQSCVYHHMDWPPQPIKYVKEGYATGRWHINKPVPFSRIILHLHRLWDYTTCPAAQLKIWLAQHLISAANPACEMWDKSAAAAIAADDYVEGGDFSSSSSSCGASPLGRYSCDLCKAGLFLQRLWREQPDPDAAATPMPYNKKLRQLFSTDQYFQVAASPHNSSHCYVRLNVSKIIDTLNW